MGLFVPSSRTVATLAIALVVMILPVYGQIGFPCSGSILSTFTPCMNFLTNSSSNGTSPTAGCCTALKSLTSNGMDCFCLIATGSVPFNLPINRTLAISMPRACNMTGVPVQCKASAAPLPAPGPTSLEPTSAPRTSPSASPEAPVVPEPTPSNMPPESSTTPALTPPSTTTTGGSPPVLTMPSAATSSHSFSPFLLAFALGFLFLKLFDGNFLFNASIF